MDDNSFLPRIEVEVGRPVRPTWNGDPSEDPAVDAPRARLVIVIVAALLLLVLGAGLVNDAVFQTSAP